MIKTIKVANYGMAFSKSASIIPTIDYSIKQIIINLPLTIENTYAHTIKNSEVQNLLKI